MDNGAIAYGLLAFLGLPFWVGIIAASLVLVLLVPIGIHLLIRIVIDALLAHRGDPERHHRAYRRRYARDRRVLDAMDGHRR